MKHHVARPFIGSGIDTRRRSVRDVRLRVIAELTAVQGQPVDIGGYFLADPEKTKQAMRPSTTFNNALASLR